MITGDTKLDTSPKPAIRTEVRLRVDGPYSEVERFRKWFKDEFKTWSKPFRCYVDGRARREDGVLCVHIDMKASAHGVICHLAELCERQFPGVYIDGFAHECGSWKFTTIATREGSLVATGPLVETFTDQAGEAWWGGSGAYEMVPYEDDEFEDELPEEIETRSESKFSSTPALVH